MVGISAMLDVGRASTEWRHASICDDHEVAPGVHEIILEVPSWPGHVAGQYVDVRVGNAGEWSPARSFSIANAPAGDARIHLMLRDSVSGVVTPYLTARGCDQSCEIQVDGPKGDRMVWQPERTGGRPLLLVGGGTGIVPLIAIARAWEGQSGVGPLCLIYSVRSLEQRLFSADLDRLDAHGAAEATTILTGADCMPSSKAERQGEGRLSTLDLEVFGLSNTMKPECFVSGPVAFVESVTRMLIEMKHDAARIHTEWSSFPDENA